MWSEITMRLPASHILSVRMTQWVPRPRHIPFHRPADSKVTKSSPSPLNRMVTNLNPGIERSEPFCSQNTPYAHKLSTLPFAGRLFINPEACPKKKKSYLANQHIWLCSREGCDTLTVFTDGSKTDKAAGWAITGIHVGRVVFQHQVPFAKRASNHDAEMMALAHASKLVRETMLGKPHIRKFRVFSDSTASLTSIFDPSHHPCQQASLMFQRNMHTLFSTRDDVTGRLVWTPGHGGLDHMTLTDKNARATTNSSSGQYLLPLFISRSAALSEVETLAINKWHAHLNSLEDDHKGIFRGSSGFRPFTDSLKSSTFLTQKPAKWFKTIDRSTMSRLTQMCTNHTPTGEYFK